MAKTCFKCGLHKELSEFYKHPMMADGRLGKCKECTKKDVAENYAKRRPEKSEYDQKRFQNPERKQKAIEYARKYRQMNPDRARAHRAVAYYVRTGKMQRLPCEVCGESRSQAHHEDYGKPLEVRWLCFRHHREAHGQVVTSNWKGPKTKK
jgi:hypothetical protein